MVDCVALLVARDTLVHEMGVFEVRLLLKLLGLAGLRLKIDIRVR